MEEALHLADGRRWRRISEMIRSEGLSELELASCDRIDRPLLQRQVTPSLLTSSDQNQQDGMRGSRSYILQLQRSHRSQAAQNSAGIQTLLEVRYTRM